MKIELMQLAGRDGDTAYNLQRTLAAIADCAPDSDLLVFAETQLCGFPNAANVRQLAEPRDGPSVQALLRAVRERDVAVLVGMLEADGGQVYNSSLLITPQGVALHYRKTHLWPDERDLVTAGDRFATVEWRGRRIGLLICWDAELLLIPFGFQQGSIPGFEDAVKQVAVGGKVKAYIPSMLAYGMQGSPPKIKPYDNLIFEIEVLSIGAPTPPAPQQMPPQNPNGQQ